MRISLIVGAVLALASTATAQDGWREPFGLGVDDDVHALRGDGQGHLYVGGEFLYGQGERLNGVGRWSGTQWSPLGGGVDGEVYAIETVGVDVFVAGHFSHVWSAEGDTIQFTRNIARWDGDEWHQVGGGTLAREDSIFALSTNGSSLFAAGNFSVSTLGLFPAQNVSAFNGLAWQQMGTVSKTVRSIDATGTSPIIGGDFDGTSGGQGTQYVARWAGAEWEPLGLGVSGPVTAVESAGADIFVAGNFHRAYNEDGTEVRTGSSPMYIAKFSGGTWSPLADFLDGLPLAMDSEGGDLYIGGSFNRTEDSDLAGNPVVESEGVMRWTGTQWEAMGEGVNVRVNAIEAEPGSIWVGGNFSYATNEDVGLTEPGRVVANHIARFGANQWHALGYGLNGLVASVAEYDGKVVLGGTFTKSTFGSITEPAHRIVGWDPSERTWTGYGNGVKWLHSEVDSDVRAMAVDGPALYVGGLFDYAFDTSSDSVQVNHIARWTESGWESLGAGFNNSVQALLMMDGDLYAGGFFSEAINADGSAVDASHIARWDGTEWHPVGGGLSSNVYALATDGTNLFAGGVFEQAGAIPNTVDASGVARWDGSAWHPLGQGLQEGLGVGGRPHAYALGVLDGTLYVAGDFVRVLQTDGSTIEANHIAAWNEVGWSALESGVHLDRAGGDPDVRSVAIRNGQVYVAGRFDAAGSTSAFSAARWDGATWRALGGGFNVVADRTASIDAIGFSGDNLYAGGFFFDVEGYPNGFVTRWDASGDVAAATASDPLFDARPAAGSAYPNPFADHLTLEFEAVGSRPIQVEVYDLLGRLVTRTTELQRVGPSVVRIPSSDWAAGAYVYVVRSGDGPVMSGVAVRGGR